MKHVLDMLAAVPVASCGRPGTVHVVLLTSTSRCQWYSGICRLMHAACGMCLAPLQACGQQAILRAGGSSGSGAALQCMVCQFLRLELWRWRKLARYWRRLCKLCCVVAVVRGPSGRWQWF
jgi:hypothetical protein